MATQEQVDLVERIKACVVAGKDPKPLQLELARLIAQGNKDGNSTKGGPVPADHGLPSRAPAARPQDRRH